MKELLQDQSNRREAAGLNPDSSATQNVDVPTVLRDKRVRVRWISMPDDERKNLILDRCREFVKAGNNLSQGSLTRSGLNNLNHAINRYYPGGLVGVQAEIGIAPQSASNYWEVQIGSDNLPRDKNGRILWSRLRGNPERLKTAIEAEIAKFISTGNHYSQDNLKAAGLSSLSVVISKYYPGGSEAVREKFGIKLGRKQRNRNYWQPDVIRQEAKGFFEETSRLSLDFLEERGRSDLTNAIRHYPGGMQQLQRDLGLEPTRRHIGYWTEEIIEKTALEIYLTEDDLSITILEKLGRHDLISAINKKYPGRILALREKLGIPNSKPENTISPDQARAELWSFLEEEDE